MKGEIADIIIKHYKETPIVLKDGAFVPKKNVVLSNLPQGLGDTLMLTDLPKASSVTKTRWTCFSISPHFRPLMARNPYWREPELCEQMLLVNAAVWVRYADCGNGHYLQRIRRAFRCLQTWNGHHPPVDFDVPRPCVAWKGERFQNRCILHFDPGEHAQWQRQHVHPHARMLSDQSKLELEAFIREHRDMEFLQVGSPRVPVVGARVMETPTLDNLIDLIGSASWFIGIMSGPLHLATALQLRCIVVCNFPEKIVMPCLHDTGVEEEFWYYPQNVHLHQERDSVLAPKLNLRSLNMAMEGQVYPFWTDEYCHLIHEYAQAKATKTHNPGVNHFANARVQWDKTPGPAYMPYSKWKKQQEQSNPNPK